MGVGDDKLREGIVVQVLDETIPSESGWVVRQEGGGCLQDGMEGGRVSGSRVRSGVDAVLFQEDQLGDGVPVCISDVEHDFALVCDEGLMGHVGETVVFLEENGDESMDLGIGETGLVVEDEDVESRVGVQVFDENVGDLTLEMQGLPVEVDSILSKGKPCRQESRSDEYVFYGRRFHGVLWKQERMRV